METIVIHFPNKLIVGSGTTKRLPEEVARFGAKKVLILTIDPLLLQLDSLVRQLQEASVEVKLDTSIVQEPYFSDFEKLIHSVSSLSPHMVVGIGGGSVLDVAKLVAAQLANHQQ